MLLRDRPTHYSVPINVHVARASLAMLEGSRDLLDGDPEADAGLVWSGYVIVAPPGPKSDAVRASIGMQRSRPTPRARIDKAVQADHRLPAFGEGRLVRSWSGLYYTTPDWNPVLAPVPGIDGLQVAFGFSGHGFKLSPIVGRQWKRELQALANELGLEISVHHFPPGASKWNKIEHRLFSFITQNWRANPLVGYQVIVDLIGNPTTRPGLSVLCELDTGLYPKGLTVSDQEMHDINIQRNQFHGEWNHPIRPSVRVIDF